MEQPPAAQPATEKPQASRKVWMYRAPLLVLLVFAVLALVFDYTQRGRQQAAYATASEIVPTDEHRIAQDEELWPSVVHEALGREPDATPVNTPDELQEVYRWRGTFYTYTVRVVYRRDFPTQPKHTIKEVYSE